MNIQEIADKIPAIVATTSLYIDMVPLIIGYITLAATFIAKVTPTKADDQVVGNFTKKLLAILQWLPTIGINPKTKKLEEELYELKEKTQPGV